MNYEQVSLFAQYSKLLLVTTVITRDNTFKLRFYKIVIYFIFPLCQNTLYIEKIFLFCIFMHEINK